MRWLKEQASLIAMAAKYGLLLTITNEGGMFMIRISGYLKVITVIFIDFIVFYSLSDSMAAALGISGQIQHVAAIAGARKVIAVNRDASAPIFQVADYGWVGDIEDALPALLETFQSCGR